MSVLEVIVKLDQQAEHYHRRMRTDVIFASFLAILACVYTWVDVNAWIISATTASSTALIGRAWTWRSARRDLLFLVWYYQTVLAIGGVIARDVQ